MTENARKELVWDLPTRLSHWALAITVTGAWLTGELGPIDRIWHMRLGYAALVIVAFRLLWGLLGGHHARFASFLPKLKETIAYLPTVFSRKPSPHAGHNPLGVLSVIALLAVIAIQATTGLFADDDIFARGPFASSVSAGMSDQATAIHVRLPSIILALVLLHLLAIAYYSFWKGSDLARAMITGKKTVPALAADRGIEASRLEGRLWLALVIVALLALALWAALTYLPQPASSSFDSWG